MVKLNMALDHRVEVVCPKCQHRHRRNIKNGQIVEDGRWAGAFVEEIMPPISAYSEEPKTVHMKNKTSRTERDAAVVQSAQDLIDGVVLWQRWCDRFGGDYDIAQD